MPSSLYTRLPAVVSDKDTRWSSDDDETLLLEQSKLHLPLQASPPASPFSRMLFATTYIATLLLSLLTIGILLRAPPPPPAHPDPATLDRPSPYIDLELTHRVQPNRSVIQAADRTIANRPWVVGRVSRAQPSKVFPVDANQWLTPFGTMSPDIDDVLITPEVSLIIQTRGLDFGMENCAVAWSAPKEKDLRARVQNNNADILFAQGLAVWRLDESSQREIDLHKLSRDTMPARVEHIGELHAGYGRTSRTERFPCPARRLMTFEIACTRPQCLVRFTMDKEEPILGFYIEQTPTI